MTTQVVSTVGSGGTYSTFAAFAAAIPANLVTADQQWEAQQKAGQISVAAGDTLTLSGFTTDATRYISVTTEAGAGWNQQAGVRGNAYRYNSSTGCSITAAGNYTAGMNIAANYTRISNLQFKSTSFSGGMLSVSGTNCRIDSCIFEYLKTAAVVGGSSGGIWNNCLFIAKAGIAEMVRATDGAFYNCGLACVSGTASSGFSGNYGFLTVQNCYVMGATLAKSGSNTYTFVTNFTSQSSPPTGWTNVAFSTATFTNITSGSEDLRVVSGAGLIDAATTDATHTPIDASGFPRPSGAGYDGGPWEYQTVVVNNLTLSATISTTATVVLTGIRVAHPISDVSTAGWYPSTGASLYAMVDEIGPDDSDFIYTDEPAKTVTMGLTSLTDPVSSTGHVIMYRAKSHRTRQVVVALYQGSTLIASWTDTLTADYATYSHTLTGPQADSITDYTILRIAFTGVAP